MSADYYTSVLMQAARQILQHQDVIMRHLSRRHTLGTDPLLDNQLRPTREVVEMMDRAIKG